MCVCVCVCVVKVLALNILQGLHRNNQKIDQKFSKKKKLCIFS